MIKKEPYLSKIYIDSQAYKDYETVEKGTKVINNLRRVNLFIGPNNSGKSRLLRRIFSDNNLEFELNTLEFDALTNQLRNFHAALTTIARQYGLSDFSVYTYSGVLKSLNELIVDFRRLKFESHKDLVEKLEQFFSILLTKNDYGGSMLPNAQVVDWRSLAFAIRQTTEQYQIFIRRLLPEQISYDVGKVYIPIMRGLRAIHLENSEQFDYSKDNYSLRTIKDYFAVDKTAHTGIYTGLSLYSDLKMMLLGSQSKRDQVRSFEQFLSNTFFHGKELTLTPNIHDDSVHVSIGKDEFPIYHLGDGIQTLIILLYPLFFNKGRQMIFFIEEPENSIHPGLQRILLKTLLDPQFSSFQYFITTHSNHLLSISSETYECSIYSFEKTSTEEGKSIHKIEHLETLSGPLLDLLGIQASSVLLSNCSIWVEGITDRLYIRKLLELYQKNAPKSERPPVKYREDFHYSFIEYSGVNLKHFSFDEDDQQDQINSEFISRKILVIADRDSTKEHTDSAKSKFYRQLKDQLRDNFLILPCREIENLLSVSAIEATICYLENKQFEVSEMWSNTISQEDIKDQPLGQLIDVRKNAPKRTYGSTSGTLKNKVEFCKAAIKLMKWDTLPEYTKAFTKEIVDFIQRSNDSHHQIQQH